MEIETGSNKKFDIIILGGGISGTLLAIALLKNQPKIKVLILEKSIEFPQKVGESTSDLSSICLRSFGIDHLLQGQVPKAGLRFLFNEKNSTDRKNHAEFASPSFRSQYTGFQLNRKIFDEQLLVEAEKLGATIYRPVELVKSKFETLFCELDLIYKNENVKVNSRWFIDASGRARYIHHQLNWKDLPTNLHTGSIVAHYKNLKSDEEWNIAEDEYWRKNSINKGSFSTIHFMRPHRWWWLIRVDDETTSIGIVYDKEKIKFDDPEIYFDSEIEHDVQLSHITSGTTRSAIKHFEQIAYQSEKIHGPGIALIGDSATSIDPLQSPGIELIAQQTIWLKELLLEDFATKKFNERKWKKYDRLFAKSFSDRMEIYKVGYNFFGSYDLSKNWLRVGVFGYFGINVFLTVLFSRRLKMPFRLNFFSRFGFRFLVWRLNRIKKRRDRQGRLSVLKSNAAAYSGICYPKGIRYYFVPINLFSKWFFDYLKLELKEIPFWFRRTKKLNS